MVLGILNIISQVIVVTFIIVGVVMILLAIRFGADYLFGKTRDRDVEKLRDELNRDNGISEHNLFYRFFFRNH